MRSPPGSLGVCPPLTHPASLTVSIPLSLSMRWPPCFHPFQCAKNILVLLVHWASICSDLLSEARATSDLALFTHLLWTTQSLVRHQIHISTRTATGTEETPSPPQSWAYTHPSLFLLPHSLPTAADKSSCPGPDSGDEAPSRRHFACSLCLPLCSLAVHTDQELLV